MEEPAGGAAPAVAGNGGGAAQDTGRSHGNASLAPHAGMVYIDQLSDTVCALTNVATLERKDLPPGLWCLEFDEDGFGLALPNDDLNKEAIFVEEFLRRKLVYKDNGEMVMMDNNHELAVNGVVALDLLLMRHTESHFVLQWSPTRQATKFHVYRLRWPRREARTFVSFTDIYQGLGLVCFKNLWSKWAFNGWASWRAWVAKLGLDGHLLQSTQSKGKRHGFGERWAPEAVLLVASCSVWALMALCVRWSSDRGARGSLEPDDARKTSHWLLEALVKSACELRRWALTIACSEPWENLNPRPEPQCVKCECPVTADGCVDLRPLELLAVQQQAGVAAKLWRRVAGKVSNTASVKLVELLRIAADDKQLMQMNFLGQLIWRIGCRLEYSLLLRYEKGEAGQTLRVPTEPGSLALVKMSQQQQDAYLAKYLFNAEQISLNQRNISISTDKSMVNGLPIQATILAYPNNCAVVCPPVVPPPGSLFTKATAQDPAEKQEIWSDWRRWPHLSVAADQGPDGLAAAHALAYGMSVNMTFWSGPSHGVHRDTTLMLKHTGIFRVWLVVMIAMNVLHGPQDDALRHQQLLEASQQVFQRFEPAELPLWLEKGDQIAKELFRGEAVPEHNSLKLAWERAKSTGLLQRRGYKVNLNRLMGSIAGGKELHERWHSTAFAIAYCCIELDMLHGRQFLEKALMHEPLDFGCDKPGSTDPKLASALDKMLRGCTQNALVVSAIVLDEPKYKRIVGMVVKISTPSLDWHSEQNRQNRDVTDTYKWVKGQVADMKFMDHVNETFGLLSSASVLRECEFRMDKRGLVGDALNSSIIMDDEMSSLYGRLVVQLVAARLRRCLWMVSSWPSGFISFLGSQQQSDRAMGNFKADYEAFQALAQHPDPTAEMKTIIGRSVFSLLPVRQVLLGCLEFDWRLHPDIKAVIEPRFKILIGSQVVEDALNICKSHGILRTSRKYRRPQRNYCALLEKPLLDGHHRFRPLVPDILLGSKSCALAHDVFEPPAKQQPIDINRIESTTPAAEWWSPAAMNFCVPAADLPMIRESAKTGNFASMGDAWLGALLDGSHQLVFEYRMGDSPPKWFFGLHHFPGSSLMVWPAEVRNLGHGRAKLTCFIPEAVCEEPILIPILAIDGMQAVRYEWRSWLWQVEHVANCSRVLAPGIRAYQVGDKERVEVIAARCAFWSFDRALISKVMRHLDLDVSPGLGLYETLTSAVSQILHTDEEQTSMIVHQRMVHLKKMSAYTNELLHCNEAAGIMDREDMKAFKEETKQAMESTKEMEAFKSEHKVTRQRIRAAAKGRARGGRRPAGASRRLPADLSQIPHASVKSWAPPGSSIWKNNSSGEWLGRYSDLGSVARTWRRYGESTALKLVLQHLWSQYCDEQGLNREECPVEGVFDDAPTRGGAAASSSAA